jgi:RNA-binding protein
MQKISGSQRRYLKSLAHHLKPVVHVGKSGVTDPLINSVTEALGTHELVKVKFTDLKDQKAQLAALISTRTESHLVAILGNTSILYRQNPELETPKVQLPQP